MMRRTLIRLHHMACHLCRISSWSRCWATAVEGQWMRMYKMAYCCCANIPVNNLTLIPKSVESSGVSRAWVPWAHPGKSGGFHGLQTLIEYKLGILHGTETMQNLMCVNMIRIAGVVDVVCLQFSRRQIPRVNIILKVRDFWSWGVLLNQGTGVNSTTQRQSSVEVLVSIEDVRPGLSSVPRRWRRGDAASPPFKLVLEHPSMGE